MTKEYYISYTDFCDYNNRYDTAFGFVITVNDL